MKYKLPIANNSTKTKLTFDARSFYTEELYQSLVKPIDFLYEQPYYGKVNEKNIAVNILEDSTLKPIITSEIIFAVDFVADAFEDLYSYVINEVPQESRVFDMLPKRAWISFDVIYRQFLEDKRTYFLKKFLMKHKEKINSFNDFVVFFKKFIISTIKDAPFTRSAFMLSGRAPINATGLVIDLDDQNFAEDMIKSRSITNPNFLYYTNLVAKFGFFIDKNAPWRLIANISSSEMQKYMQIYKLKFAPGTSTDYFSSYCREVALDELDDMRNFLLSTYREFIKVSPEITSVTTLPSGCKQKTIIKKNNTVPLDEDLKFWLELFFFIRTEETGKKNSYENKIALAKAIGSSKADIERTMIGLSEHFAQNSIFSYKKDIENFHTPA